MEQYSLNFLKAAVPNKKALYDILTEGKGLYLPDLDSKAITGEYLCSVAKNEVFTIKRDQIKLGIQRKKPLIPDIISYLDEQVELPLGFDEVNHADKPCLANCLYTLAPKSRLFTAPVPEFTRELPAE